jgi:flavin-dependent dehydrogenase
MQFQYDVLIIGGGLGGLTTALHLNIMGITAAVLEKNPYPHHKVCGEYLSNEVLPYFKWLGIDIESLSPTHIDKFEITAQNGKSLLIDLPLGGVGISRYELDNFLYLKLIEQGGMVIEDTVDDFSFENDQFRVSTKLHHTYFAKQVIGAYGKRAAIDIKLERSFIKKKSYYLAVKAHYEGNFPDDLVALYNFNGGYCGVSKVEEGKINICYLANYETFKHFKNLADYQDSVLCQNKALKELLKNCKMKFEAPITISQISFAKKESVVDHALMIGDSAGLIHPLCGNGMAMAIHSAKICSELLIGYFNGQLKNRKVLEQSYISEWNKNFKMRLRVGHILSSLLKNEKMGNVLLNTITKMPVLLTQVIKYTHGKPLVINQ